MVLLRDKYNIFASSASTSVTKGRDTAPGDALEAYLKSPPLDGVEIRALGGVISYWTGRISSSSPAKSRALAIMFLDILSTPGADSFPSVSPLY